jgi:hypothetical protein
LDNRASTAFRYQCVSSQVLLCVLIALWSYLTFWWGNGVKGPTSSTILVLNAKGGEIKAKATGSANHLWISKVMELDSLCLIKTLLLQKNVLLRWENWLWEKGSFWHFYSWKISWFAKTSVFDIEIGKQICFVKINQVVAKVIQIWQIPWKSYSSSIWHKSALLSSFSYVSSKWVAFWCVGINLQKVGDWKRNVPLGHFYIVLVIRCTAHYVRTNMILSKGIWNKSRWIKYEGKF